MKLRVKKIEITHYVGKDDRIVTTMVEGDGINPPDMGAAIKWASNSNLKIRTIREVWCDV